MKFVLFCITILVASAYIGGFKVCYQDSCYDHPGIDLKKFSLRLKGFE